LTVYPPEGGSRNGGGAESATGLPVWKKGLGIGKEVTVCCQSKFVKPQSCAACERVYPELGVKLVVIVGPLAAGPLKALLIRDVQAVADERACSSEKYPVPPFAGKGTRKLTVPLVRSALMFVKYAFGPPYPVESCEFPGIP
jgi:hypothetical protein